MICRSYISILRIRFPSTKANICLPQILEDLQVNGQGIRAIWLRVSCRHVQSESLTGTTVVGRTELRVWRPPDVQVKIALFHPSKAKSVQHTLERFPTITICNHHRPTSDLDECSLA